MPSNIETSPKYLRIAQQLRKEIRTGALKPSERLPSFVQMRARFDTTPATVDRALGVLEREGLILRGDKRGVLVAPPERAATGIIGFIGNTMMLHGHSSIYWSRLLEGIQGAASHHRKKLLLLLEEDVTCPIRDYSELDGVLIYTTRTLPALRRAFPSLPCVSLLHSIEGMAGVMADQYGGARSAARHLTALGHRRIALLMQEDQGLSQRYAGYYDGLREAAINPDARWVRRPQHEPPHDDYMTWGREQMHAWLHEDWSELGCTALLAQNDAAAAGAMQVLQQAGIRVPQQVSIIGFDGTELCDYFMPHLTSVRIPLREIGEKAIKVLLQQIATRNQEATTILLPTHIKEGESTASVSTEDEPIGLNVNCTRCR